MPSSSSSEQTILLRVISPCSNNNNNHDGASNNNSSSLSLAGKITFIKVGHSTTVEQACQQALRAFHINVNTDSSIYTMIIETGRTRVYNNNQSGNSAAALQQNKNKNASSSLPLGGQLSMPLDPSWRLLPYIALGGGDNDDDDDDDERGDANNNSGQSSSRRNIPQNLINYIRDKCAPWSVVGYLIVKNKNDDGSSSSFSEINRRAVPPMPGVQEKVFGSTNDGEDEEEAKLPERLQKISNSMKPCAFSE